MTFQEICASRMQGKVYYSHRHCLYFVHRKLSTPITWAMLKLRVPPNTVTAIAIFVGICGLILISNGCVVVGITSLYCSFLLDKVDGEVARCMNTFSRMGIYLDELYHILVNGLFFVAFSFADQKPGGSIVVGLLCTISWLICALERKSKYVVYFKTGPVDGDKNVSLGAIGNILSLPISEDVILLVFLIGWLLGIDSFVLLSYFGIMVAVAVCSILLRISGGLENDIKIIGAAKKRHLCDKTELRNPINSN